MPKKARVDAPGALHRIIARGIKRRIDKEAIYNICQDNIDELAQTIKMVIRDLS